MKTIAELHEPSMFQWLWRVAWNWCEIGLIYYGAYRLNHWAGFLIAWVLLGTRMHALALLGHEGIHYNLSRQRALNDGVANLFAALPLGMTLNWFRKFHLTHHGHLLTEQDPEVQLRSHAARCWSMPLSTSKRLGLALLDLSGLGYLESRHVLTFAWPYMNRWDLVWPLVYWGVIWAVSLSFGAWWVPALWMLSIPTSYWAMFRQRALTEHIGTVPTYRFHAHPIARFFYLPHNTWYHWEHHEWAGIPCWNLPKARALATEGGPVLKLSEVFQSLRQ